MSTSTANLQEESTSTSSQIAPPSAVKWLSELASPMEDLKRKIKETQESINDEKRKSLSSRNKNRRQTSPIPLNKDRIEVMETLLKVYKQELEEIQQFTKQLARFVIVNSESSEVSDFGF